MNHSRRNPLVVEAVDLQRFVVVHIGLVLDSQSADHTFVAEHLADQVVVDIRLVMVLDVVVEYLDNHQRLEADLLMWSVAYDDNLGGRRHLLDSLVVVDHIP